MQNNSFTSEKLAFARIKASPSDARSASEVYDEIMTIAREIEQCRASV